MLTHSLPGNYESVASAENLGHTRDRKWLPLLLKIADTQGSGYLQYAAESGGEVAIPALISRMSSAKAGVRSSAIDAMGDTGSRAAVPLLISLLHESTAKAEAGWPDDALSAEMALEQLTHQYVRRDDTKSWINDARERWQRWWLVSGGDAKMSFPRDRAESKELPW